MFTIPPADSAARADFNSTVVGVLGADGKFYCNDCLGMIKGLAKVYGINVAPYSCVCNQCNQLIVDGARKLDNSPLCLFD